MRTAELSGVHGGFHLHVRESSLRAVKTLVALAKHTRSIGNREIFFEASNPEQSHKPRLSDHLREPSRHSWQNFVATRCTSASCASSKACWI